MNNNMALAKQDNGTGAIMERVLIVGNLAELKPQERVQYYNAVCESVGLNPLTRPFEYITLNGKLTLYARKDATDQLRKIHGVSIIEMTEQEREGVLIITAKAQDASGRLDISKGAVSLGSLKGEALANAFMKAETKAKRRVTLSICGLGLLDETEVQSIPDAKAVTVTIDGEIVQPQPGKVLALPQAAGSANDCEATGKQTLSTKELAQRLVDINAVSKTTDGYTVTTGEGTRLIQKIEGKVGCNCNDFIDSVDPDFQCAHILAVYLYAKQQQELDAKAAGESAR